MYDLKQKFFTDFANDGWATIFIGQTQLLVTAGVPVVFIGITD